VLHRTVFSQDQYNAFFTDPAATPFIVEQIGIYLLVAFQSYFFLDLAIQFFKKVYSTSVVEFPNKIIPLGATMTPMAKSIRQIQNTLPYRVHHDTLKPKIRCFGANITTSKYFTLRATMTTSNLEDFTYWATMTTSNLNNFTLGGHHNYLKPSIFYLRCHHDLKPKILYLKGQHDPQT
jgi:hypothetical protein